VAPPPAAEVRRVDVVQAQEIAVLSSALMTFETLR
jgi:hypothetical protein